MQKFTLRIGAEELIIEVGKMARQANGSVFARYGGSTVLATVCCAQERRENLDFVPVSVDYNERYYAAGKIPGGFLKREARPKDKEILVSRLIDRPMRPLFSKAFGREIQVVPMTISTDKINPPDILGMNAAFSAVMISDIPFNGPVAAVRVVRLKPGKEKAAAYIVNPSFAQIEDSDMEIVVAGGKQGICMVEGGAQQVSEAVMLEAIRTAEGEIQRICDFMLELQQKCGKTKLPLPESDKKDFPLAARIRELAVPKLEAACFEATKEQRHDSIRAARSKVFEALAPEFEKLEDGAEQAAAILHDLESEIVRKAILKDGRRCDGRKTNEIRPIATETGILPQTHGSALFTRGETQSLGVVTLGSIADEQIMDDIDGDRRARFMLHYNFPPYSVGETGRLGTGRREIGHGHLAQRSLENVLPEKDRFPYTIRVVSEILESNGSSSMATVCSGSMALMDAGVPLAAPVAGIAMGLVSEGPDMQYAILSDILGEEDHLGDMDFKVAGTETGITGFQMDIKISGISLDILSQALHQAKEGRLHILGIMNECISKPRVQVSDTAPAIKTLQVEVEKIGAIIGPGGKFIRAIADETGAKIDIANDGKVTIFATRRSNAEAALAHIQGIVSEPQPDTCYTGKVKRIVDFGAFIEFLPGKEGLCHISKIAKERVHSVGDYLTQDQEVRVKLMEIDRMGRYNLSIVDAS